MKKTIFTAFIAILMAGATLTGCQSPNKKVEDARENLADSKDQTAAAKQELNQAIVDSIQQYKMESELKISTFEKNIADLKVEISTLKNDSKAEYEKQLNLLEKKNAELKMKLEDFKEAGNESWDSFKAEFNHDMDEMGKAISDLGKNNVK